MTDKAKPYTVFELAGAYKTLVDGGFEPLLITNDAVYNISPIAVRDIQFMYDRILFTATFNRYQRDVEILNKHVIALTRNDI